MEEIYDADIVGSFRDYCTAEPAWEVCVRVFVCVCVCLCVCVCVCVGLRCVIVFELCLTMKVCIFRYVYCSECALL